MRRVVFLGFSLLFPLQMTPAAAGDAAHDLAQKFAIEERKPNSKPAATAKPASRQMQAQAQPAATKPRATAPAADPSKDYEKEMLEAARAEAEARKAGDKTAATAPAADPVPAAAPPASAAGKPAPVTEKAAVTPAPSPGAQPRASGAAAKATVLVVLSQSAADGSGLRTFDPIICLGKSCFVSTGPGSDARATSRDDALSTKNAVTQGAGACEGQMGCVFRGVTFEQGASLQVIDLGLVNHQHHEPLEAKIDATCGLDDGDLVCKTPLTAPDYRIWILPEALAAQVGAEKLAAALDDELPEENVTLDTDK